MDEKPSYNELLQKVYGLEKESLERQQSEIKNERLVSMLRATLEATADGIAVVDREGKIVRFNQRFKEILGIPESVMAMKDDNLVIGHILTQVKDREAFLKKIGDLYDDPDAQDHDIVEFKDGRIFERYSLPEQIEGKTVGRVWSFRDITARKRTEKNLQKSFKTLQKAMDGVIQAMALTVEKRDPYTAGHQRRVADLAEAISREMGLSKKQVNGISLAATIHDVGKTSIPADILSKPGSLTDHEFGIIKTHPVVGYDIMKGIEFPWPIAQSIRQHHERLDGSGYPDGLMGEAIIVEARIIAVSDVVEAMSSHRPYRAALGIEKALEEIAKKKNTFYDPVAVDVCLWLFKEKGFKLDNTTK